MWVASVSLPGAIRRHESAWTHLNIVNDTSARLTWCIGQPSPKREEKRAAKQLKCFGKKTATCCHRKPRMSRKNTSAYRWDCWHRWALRPDLKTRPPDRASGFNLRSVLGWIKYALPLTLNAVSQPASLASVWFTVALCCNRWVEQHVLSTGR